MVAILAATAFATFGGSVFAATPQIAHAELPSPFEVTSGTVMKADGEPAPDPGTQVALWSNQSQADITLEGPGRLNVAAIGDYCGGWPILRVEVDGKTWWKTRIVDAKRYGSYATGRALPAGSHNVSISMVNDRYSPASCDRNAYVANAWIEPPVDVGDSKPDPTEPTEPEPTKPEPTKPDPTEPTPSDPGPSEPEPTEPGEPSDPPVQGGTPGASNTGVPEGTKLKVHNGDLKVTKDNTVLDGRDIRGSVDVRADNVTIKNSVIRGRSGGSATAPLVSAYDDQKNLKIVDSTLDAARPSEHVDGLKGSNFVARRLEITNVVDTVQVIGGTHTLIEDSWLHSNSHFTGVKSQPDGKTHDDNIQVEGGAGATIRGNRLEGADNAAIMVTQNHSRVSKLTVTDNLLAGGACTVNVDDKGRGPINAVIADNRFGASKHNGERCPMVVPGSSALDIKGNTFASSGDPATARKR